jgi:hypothetical protein
MVYGVYRPFQQYFSYIVAVSFIDKVYQLLAHDRWFSPGTPASSTTKTDHHDSLGVLDTTLYDKVCQ